MFRLSPSSLALSPRFEVDSLPSLPSVPNPQQANSPLSRIAQVMPSPAAMDAAVVPVGRSTSTRLSPISPASSPMLLLLPTPSSPAPFSPQHAISPSSQSTQECVEPVAIWEIPWPLSGRSTCGNSPPTRSASVSPMTSVFPRPSWPASLSPQQTTDSDELSFTMAQVCIPPESIAEASQLPSFTLSTFDPISWYPSPLAPDPSTPALLPSTKFRPQHLTEASLSRAQVESSPPETSENVSPLPTSVNIRYCPISSSSSP